MSTCGALHSIGSDLTRMKVRSEINQNGSIRSEQTISKTKEPGNTPTSRVEVMQKRNIYSLQLTLTCLAIVLVHCHMISNSLCKSEQPVASRESFVPRYENGRANGNTNYNDEVDGVICSRSSQERRSRKTSTVCF